MKGQGRPCCLLFVLGLLVAGACAPAIPSPVGAPAAASPRPPTEAPTALPMPPSMVTAWEGAYATQAAARETAIVVHATASPFPTSGPVELQTGRPSIARARRDGLCLEIRLSANAYLAGEAGRAAITVRNDGPEALFVQNERPGIASLWLLDARGRPPDPWPWVPASFPGSDRSFPVELAPGEMLTGTATFQIPSDTVDSGIAGQRYVLWAEVHFSRPALDTPQRPDNRWLSLEAGPIPLRVLPPGPAQHLVASLEATRAGWHLRVTDSGGRVPPGPLWGFQEVTSFNSISAGPLPDTLDGDWSKAWHEDEWEAQSDICLRTWVAAPGYVTAVVTATVPGTGEAPCMSWAPEPPLRRTFFSLEAAQVAVSYPLYRPGLLPAGTRLEEVRIETMPYYDDEAGPVQIHGAEVSQAAAED